MSARSLWACMRSIPAWAGETHTSDYGGYQYEVYPRVGGGNAAVSGLPFAIDGLSPRGRGKLRASPRAPLILGSIPAWAGETRPKHRRANPVKVYPRVGGGNAHAKAAAMNDQGLSPRGRGKPRYIAGSMRGARSIPAWAGETILYADDVLAKGVYPRVGGGNAAVWAGEAIQDGLSPRGRGKLRGIAQHFAHARSIPAWAGETTAKRTATATSWVYPRVGGGNARYAVGRARVIGLSPRGRGKQPRSVRVVKHRGSIPAWAGETKGFYQHHPPFRVYPRVGGGNTLTRSPAATA